jgi:Fic family protein
MKQPPGQILFTRPAYEWINRVAQKHAELEKLALSEKERESLRRLSESEFVYSAARLAGLPVSPAQVSRVVDLAALEIRELSDADRGIAERLSALRVVEALAESEGPQASLTPELLMKLNDPLGINESKFRMNAAATGPFKPAPAEHIPALIESACRWLTADSFFELNPLEQASITHLRLLEIHPFERANLETALVAASLFTMRNRMPPIIIKQEDSTLYRAAIEEGARMNTRPMVELMAIAMEKRLSEMIMSIISLRA